MLIFSGFWAVVFSLVFQTNSIDAGLSEDNTEWAVKMLIQ